MSRYRNVFFTISSHDLLRCMDPPVLFEFSIIGGRLGPRSFQVKIFLNL